MTFDLRNIFQKLGKRYIPIVILVMSLILFGFMFGSVRQKQADFKVGKLAEETIRANKTIENKKETEEKQRLAVESVSPEYTYDANKEKNQLDLVDKLFTMVDEVNSETAKKYQADLDKAKDKKSVFEPKVEEKIPLLKSKFEKLSPENLAFYQSFPDNFYEQIFSLSSSELLKIKTESSNIIQQTMGQKIRNSNLQIEKQKAVEKVQFLNFNNVEQQIVERIVERSIIVNEVANDKATDKMKEIALSAVQPAMIYQGEIIVREGEQIDSKAMEKINLLGLNNQSTSVSPILAMIIALLLQIILVVYFVFKDKDLYNQSMNLTFYFVAIIFAVLLMKMIYLFQKDTTNAFGLLFPAAFGPLMLHLYVGKRWGILLSMFQGIFATFIFYDMAGTTSLLVISLFYIFTGCIATFLQRKRISEQLTQASFLLILIPVLFINVLIAYQGMGLFDSRTLTNIFVAFVSGLFSFILSIGLHPYIELMVTDDSVIVLNELSNPNHPLLKQLLEEAPGTYHHSMMVASLSANAVAEIGGRSLLTRVACYYHDIGKLKHANFFVENLPAGAENPHNFLLPSDSKEIIFGHVTDGVKVLEEAEMPQFIIDVCRQHHGTTLMKYFYIKEKERNNDTSEASFRYPGPIPQCREIGVINIADSAEAAVRAMDNPTNEKIKDFVHQLIQGRIDDGQLLDSGLTLKELKIIEQSIVTGLSSTFHSRIKYPKMKSEAEQMKQEQEERGD